MTQRYIVGGFLALFIVMGVAGFRVNKERVFLSGKRASLETCYTKLITDVSALNPSQKSDPKLPEAVINTLAGCIQLGLSTSTPKN